jgi:putative oxidoreductase
MTLATASSPSSVSSSTASQDAPRLILPFMSGFYANVAEPVAFAGFRIGVGVALILEGWPKIQAPFAQVAFVENLHFYPGWFWSPLLAIMQFFGGFLLVAGLLTRPIALANAVMLAITLYFHMSHPYGDALLTQAGLKALGDGSLNAYLTPAALAKVKDGGHAFLFQVQDKAEMLSFLWTGAAFFYAAFGGGKWSLDRLIGKEF